VWFGQDRLHITEGHCINRQHGDSVIYAQPSCESILASLPSLDNKSLEARSDPRSRPDYSPIVPPN